MQLCHYGIPGMRWGVRRYQNYDGSLTSLGQRRYGGNGDPTDAINKQVSADYSNVKAASKDASNISKSAGSIVRRSNPKKKIYTVTKKQVHEMSEQEMRKQINRILLENQYREVTAINVDNSTAMHVADIIDTVGDLVIIGGGIAGIASVVYRLA